MKEGLRVWQQPERPMVVVETLEAHPPPHHRADSFGASDCATRWSLRRCWRAPPSCYSTCIVGLSPSLLRKGAYKALMGLSASI